MEKCFLIGTAGVVLLCAEAAFAANFPISGNYYNANVLYRPGGITSVSESLTGCSSNQGIPTDIVDFTRNLRAVSGAIDNTRSMVETLTLDKTYWLGKINTTYYDGWAPYTNASYQLRVYDGASWTTVKSQTPLGGSVNFNDTFTPQNVTKIEVTTWGPGANGASGYLMLTEVEAFVATAGVPGGMIPQIGYGPSLPGTLVVGSDSNWQGYAPASYAVDNNLANYATPSSDTPTATYDLGASYPVWLVRPILYQDWTSGIIDISTDLTHWTTVTSGALTSNTFYSASMVNARYVRITGVSGVNGKHVAELEVFVAPEPATLTILGLSGLLLLRRRRACPCRKV